MKKELKETVGLMKSSFYKARFAAEYLQVKIRLDKLKNMLVAWDNGTLLFIPSCPRPLYDKQVQVMEDYIALLIERAKIENVKLVDYEEDSHDFCWAMKQMLEGKRVTLPEWGGYWYLGEDGEIWIYTKDGQTLNTPMYDVYAARKDWKIYDEVNEQLLKEYQESITK